MDKFVVDLLAQIARNPDIRDFAFELADRVVDRVVDRLTPDVLQGGLFDTIKRWLNL